MNEVTNDLISAGFVINFKKSELEHTYILIDVSVHLQSTGLLAILPQPTIKRLLIFRYQSGTLPQDVHNFKSSCV